MHIGRMTKKELYDRLRAFLIKCLRKIRAYNFNGDLVEQIELYYDKLYNSEYVADF